MAPLTLTFEGVDGLALSGDLYRPDGPGPHPVLVAAPGGGWLRNRREQLVHWGEYLSAAGFAVFAIDYRRSDKGKCFPGNVQDVGAAIDFIRDQAAGLDLDAARLGLLGASAGAHLASLATLTGEPRDVRVLVLAYGVYDLFAQWDAARQSGATPGDDMTERMLGCDPYDDPELYFAASPRLQVTRARAVALKAMLIWGDADEVVRPPLQSQAFARALEQAGAHVETDVTAGAGHFWFSNDPITDPAGATAAVAPRVVRFLKSFLG
jgi:acetyl esterase/lipase